MILSGKTKRHFIERRFEEVPKMTCYPSQLGQVFTNLIGNASDALDEKNTEEKKEGRNFEGKILISMESHNQNGKLELWLRVQDNGNGVP